MKNGKPIYSSLHSVKVGLNIHQASISRTSQHAKFCIHILYLLVCIHKIDCWVVSVPAP